MNISSFSVANDSFWAAVCKHVDKSVVFIDKRAAECLHWSDGVGIVRLYDHGALAVKDFSSFESGSSDQSKAVFIVTSCVTHLTLKVTSDIVQNSRFRHCVVLTSADASVQSLSAFGRYDGTSEVVVGRELPFSALEQQLLAWMGNKNFKAEVHYVPIFICCLSSFMFVTPPFDDLFPPMSDNFDLILETSTKSHFDKKPIESLSDLTLASLPFSLRIQVRQLVVNLNSVFEALNAKEELYNVGYFSRIIATEMEQLNQARNRRKVAPNKISVLFVDRTLDLAQVTSYDFETLLDKILHLLPNIPSHTTDVAIDVSALSSSETNSVVFGSLAGHARSETSTSSFQSIITNKPKECVLELNRQLVETASKLGLSRNTMLKPGRVNVDTLETQIVAFRNNPNAIYDHAGLLQHALAAVQAMRHVDASKLDTLFGVEKALLQTLIESPQSLLVCRLITIIKDRVTRGLTFEDIFVLVVHFYALVGGPMMESCETDDETNLKSVFGDALLADSDCLPTYLKSLIGDEVNELSVHGAVEHIFTVLHAIAYSRGSLRKYSSIVEYGNAAEPSKYLPLMTQITNDMYDPSKPDLVDVECRTSGLKDMLKSGLGLFMNMSKPRPSDTRTLIVFIVGGTTSTEIRRIREAVFANSPSTQISLTVADWHTSHMLRIFYRAKGKEELIVLVGSTRFSLPKDTLKQLFRKPDW